MLYQKKKKKTMRGTALRLYIYATMSYTSFYVQKTMASKKFITLVVLFILTLLFASSKGEFTGVAEASKLGG